MFKLIKYELIGKYKSFGILAAISIILNLALMSRLGVWPNAAIVFLSFFILGSAGVVLLIWCIGLFGEDLYGDKGYLTYILPKKGYSILGSKLITSLIFYIIIYIITGLFIVYFIGNATNIQMGLDSLGIRITVTKLFFIILTFMCIQAIALLMQIYFAISLTRMAVAKKRGGKFAAFVVFIIISIISGFITYALQHLFPQEISLNVINGFTFNMTNSSSELLINNGIIPFNISVLIFNIVIFWVWFFLSAYIIESKVDL